MASCRSVFNPDWTNKELNPEFSDWVESVEKDPYSARCRYCRKTFILSNMGRRALISHASYKKHKSAVESLAKNAKLFSDSSKPLKTEAANGESQEALQESQVTDEPRKNQSILKFIGKEEVLKAEILWALKLVASHSSYNSFKDAAEIFKLMFPDSEISKKVTLGSSKMAYVIAFGLSPYFHKELLDSFGENMKFVICMDEALNKISQKTQMDLIIRYWPENCSEVQVRYLNSVFLGHSTAQDLFESFIAGSSDLDLLNLLQISIDGPNVNLKFLRYIQDQVKESKGHNLIDIGTCSLHVIHNAFQRGNKITRWKLNEILRALYQLFKNSPARRADYISSTQSDLFPLKFCQVRWIENVSVAERAIQIFPNIKKYYDSHKTSLPHYLSIGNLESACSDKLILAKLAFFSSVAAMLEPFLKGYQTSKPMVPFLYDSVSELMRNLMLRFIKRNVITEANTASKLFEIKVDASKNHLHVTELNIGIGARSYVSRSAASELEKTQFLQNCKEFYIEMTNKIIEKFNAKFITLRSLSCINPIVIRNNPTLSEKRMDSLLQSLHSTSSLSALTADSAKQQFISFINHADNKKQLSTFSESQDRLDTFYHSLLSSKVEYKDLWTVVKMVLTLSHGNASVESGFSVNNDILVENMKENSLIALRRTYDAIKSKGGVASVVVTPEMLQNAKLSRQRYHQALEENKKKEETETKKLNEKRKIQDQIKVLRNKKAKLAQEATVQAQKINEEIYELEKNLNC